jgi:N-acetylmuramoyl-L-alanine amidase
MPRVIISSGHTSANPGTVAGDLREVDLARKIAKATLPFLRQNGVITLSVPPELDLDQRIEWINKTGYNEEARDVTVEIHINDGGKSGIEVWYEAEGNNESQKLAQSLLSETTSQTKLPSQGTKSEYDHDLGSLAFLHETNPVSALIECGYIDNESDAKFLRDEKNIELTGKGIAIGILRYLNIEYREAPAQAASPAMQQQLQTVQPPPRPVSVPPQPARATIPPAPQMDDFGDDFFGTAAGFGNAPAQPGTFGSAFPQPVRPGQATGGFNALPSREDRKEMIKKSYIKILGREPNQNDLNYFLNIGITEDQLLKKMIDSQEHADLVKARQEVIQTKQNFNDQQAELSSLRASVADQDKIIMQLQNSIDQKNLALSEMQRRIDVFQKIQVERGGSEPASTVSEAPKVKGSFLERLFRAFSDIFD